MTHGTGAIFRPSDIRDWHLERLPGVQAALADLPSSFSVLPMDQIRIYDQGSENSCVAFSGATCKSIEDFQESKRWNVYDADELYHACGGPADGSRGINTDTALAYTRDVGYLDIESKQRFKIAGYAFAPPITGEWRRTIAAALVATGPCVIATLLPQSFGWDSSGPSGGDYHQMGVSAYEGLGDNDNVLLPNTWGRFSGRNGFFRLTWGYLEGNNFQNGYCYGAKLIDAKDLILPPPPPPPIVPIIKSVKVRKSGKNLIVVGTFSADVMIRIDKAVAAPNVVEINWLRLTGLHLSRGAHQIALFDGATASAPYTFIVE